MLRRLASGLLLLGACYRPSATPCEGASCGDAAGDGGGDEICAGSATGFFGEPLCFTTREPIDLQLDAGIDTSFDERCEPNYPDACVIAASSISVRDVTLDVRGALPLVLWSASTIEIGGEIDVASRRELAKDGPGGRLACDSNHNGQPNNMATPFIGSGGAGGSFGTFGGNGGNGLRGTSGTIAVGALRSPTLESPSLVGGCGGGNGGHGGANGGRGGGVLYLIAHESITLASGSGINASGAPGDGGGNLGGILGGGGGGGSGGVIGFDAPKLALMETTLIALGGGGGSGGSGNSAGNPGAQPILSPVAPGRGGQEAIAANRGGDGNALTNGAPPGQGQAGGSVLNAQDGGGGGGGGGAGYIVHFATMFEPTNSRVEPPFSQ